jgi:dipeptidyl aminopeptidase/acylaminoacyl peptidase
MKSFLPILSLLLCLSTADAQAIVNVFQQDKSIKIQYDNGNTKEIVLVGDASLVGYSRTRNLIIYESPVQKSKTAHEEGSISHDQVAVRCYNPGSGQDSLLFTTCHDGSGGTRPAYANSSIYPFETICGFYSPTISPDGERLYFESSAWTVSNAVHYYNLKTRQLVFFKAGWLQKVTTAGVEVQITSIEIRNNQGNVESRGRYTQYCLFDVNGNLIRELSEKEF